MEQAKPAMLQLEQVGRERAEMRRGLSRIQARLEDLIRQADAAGIDRSRIVSASGLSRQAVYDILGAVDEAARVEEIIESAGYPTGDRPGIQPASLIVSTRGPRITITPWMGEGEPQDTPEDADPYDAICRTAERYLSGAATVLERHGYEVRWIDGQSIWSTRLRVSVRQYLAERRQPGRPASSSPLRGDPTGRDEGGT